MSQKPSVPVDRWAMFRGLSWWQLVLALAPIALIALGGGIGGAIGGAAAWVNLKIARQPWHAVAQVAAMIGVGGAAFAVYLMIAGAILSALN